MTGVKKLSLLAGVAFAAVAAPAMTYAAEAAAPVVQEVVVTAEKREQNVRDVPQSVTAISGDALQLQRAVSFEDYVTRVPGMNLVSSQPGRTRLVLRGINAGGVSATIGTYVDETPYGSVTGLANGAVLAPDLDTYDMQRVEVLRGPQGTLYGASSLGGLLKFVTNAPDTSKFAARAEADVEGTKSAPTAGSIKGMINIPLSEMAAVRGTAYYSDQPGFIDDPVRHATNVNGNKLYGGRISALIKPSDKLQVRLSAATQTIDSKGSSIMDVNRITLAPINGDLTQSRTFSTPAKVTYNIYNLTAAYDFGPANLTWASSYGELHQVSNADGTAQLGALLTAIFKQPLGVGVTSDLKQKKYTQEIRLASPAGKFEWQVGGFYTREDNDLAQNLSAINLANPPAVATGFGGLQLVDLASRYTEYAAFGDIDYHFTDQFDVSIGGRYSSNRQKEAQGSSGPLAGPASTFTGSSSEDVFTFAIAPKYKLSEDATVYARVSKGYRPGGPNALNPLAPAAVPRTFQSDSIINYEVGIKGDAADHAVNYDLTAFYINWKDIQLLANVQNFGVNTNGGTAVSKGLEGEVSWTVTPEFQLSANGALTDAYLTENTPALTGGKDGDRLPYSSPVAGAVSADYRHALSDDLRVFAGASVRFTGRRRTDFNAAVGQTSLPAYTTVDLHAGLDFKNVRVEAYVKNLNDERGIISLAGNGATPGGANAVQAGLIRPRTVGLSLSASY